MKHVLPPEARLPEEMYKVAFALRNQLEMHLKLWVPAAPGLRAVVEFAAQHILVGPGVFDRALDVVANGSGARLRKIQRLVERPGGMIMSLDVAGKEQEDEGEEEDEDGESEEEEEDEEWEEWLDEKEEEEEIIPAGMVLPSQLLPAIFARMPLPDIQTLRLLSKEWKSTIDTPGSDFRRVKLHQHRCQTRS